MGAVTKTIDKSALKLLVPISALSEENFNKLADKTVIEELPAGQVLFNEGDKDNKAVYLLSGKVILKSNNKNVETLTGDSESARYPLAHQNPRQLTAQAKSKVTIVRIDTQLLDVLLTKDDGGETYEVSEIDDHDDSDWMTRILQSKAFANLPPANIQSLFMHLEPMEVKTGDVIIRQGDAGEYYYIIQHGRCKVTRSNPTTKEEITLAELSNGDTFGEEALISDARRNATITMLTDGELMRLAKSDFNDLMKRPLLDWLEFDQAEEKVSKGEAVWLDVRLPNEHQQSAIPGSLNIPLSLVRRKASQLTEGKDYIVYCDSGKRSSVAAFLLKQRGFKTFVLSGGYQAPAVTAPAEEVPAKQEPDVTAAAEKPEAEVIAFKAKPSDKETEEAAAAKQAEEAKAAALKKAEEKKAAEAEVNRLKEEQKEAIRKAEEEARFRAAEVEGEAHRLREEAEEAKRQAEEEAARLRKEAVEAQQKAREEAERLKKQQEEARKQAEQEAEKIKREAAEAKRQAEEEAARFREEAEAAKQKAREEAERLKKQQEEARKQAEEEAKRIKEAELARKQAEEEARKLKQEAEEAKKLAQQEAKQRQEKQAQLLAKAEAARKKAEAEMARFKVEQEALRLRSEEQLAKLQAEADVARSKIGDMEQKQVEAEAERLKAEKEAATLKAEAETARLKAEEDAARLRMEAETMRISAEQDASKMRADAEAARIKAEEEAARLRAEAKIARADIETSEESRIKEAARLETEAKAAQMEAEEAAKMINQAEEAQRQAAEASEKLLAEAETARKTVEQDVERMRKEAEQMRQQALRDVEKLKQQTEKERLQAEKEAERARQKAEQAKQKAAKDKERLQGKASAKQEKAQAEIAKLQDKVEAASTQSPPSVPPSPAASLAGKIPTLGEDDSASSAGIVPPIPEMTEKPVPLVEAEEISSGEETAPQVAEIPEIEVPEPVAEIPEVKAAEPVAEIPEEKPEDEVAEQEPAPKPKSKPVTEQDFLSDLVEATKTKAKASPPIPPAGEVAMRDVEEAAQLVDSAFAMSTEREDVRHVAKASPTGGSRKTAMFAGVGVAAIAVVIGGWFLFSGSPQPTTPEAVAPEAPVTAKAPTTTTVAPEAAPETSAEGQVPAETSVAPTVSSAPEEFQDTLKGGGKGPVMVVIPAGSFEMGSSSVSTNFDERPRHTVSVPRFAMSRYEVSVAEYKAFLRATGRKTPAGLGSNNHPATWVSWNDASAYAEWLSAQTGKKYRLPTEAEWEYATAAGNDTFYWWGNEATGNKANCFGCGSQWDMRGTAPVDSFAPNAFGIQNTAGNVMEWTQDCYHKNYQGAPGDGSAWLENSCKQRVARGGAFNTPTSGVRTAKRVSLDATARENNLGIRLVREY